MPDLIDCPLEAHGPRCSPRLQQDSRLSRSQAWPSMDPNLQKINQPVTFSKLCPHFLSSK